MKKEKRKGEGNGNGNGRSIEGIVIDFLKYTQYV